MGRVFKGHQGRVGDCEHGMYHFVNMLEKRLTSNLAELVQGVPGIRNIMANFVDIWDELQDDAKGIPVAKSLFQKRTKEGQCHISTSKHLLQKPTCRTRLVAALRQHFPMRRASGVYVWVVVDVLLRNFTSLYGLWKERVPLIAAQISAACAHTARIGECWVKMGWESSPWVHWVVAHSTALLKRYGTLCIFSSIPSEHRHKPFKVVVKNSFRGWCL